MELAWLRCSGKLAGSVLLRDCLSAMIPKWCVSNEMARVPCGNGLLALTVIDIESEQRQDLGLETIRLLSISMTS